MKLVYYKMRAALVGLLLKVLPRNMPVVLKGNDSSLQLCEQVALLGYQKALIVTDAVLQGAGVLDGILEQLQHAAVDYAIYAGVLPDPVFDQVQAGDALLRAEHCDCIIAVGGGSVLDAAKMIAMLHTNPGELKSFAGIQPCKHSGVPLFAIPTTAGTGAEVTGAAVITDPLTHEKMPVLDSKMLPGFVALDAKIMQSMPAGVTAATGMDALTHAVEAYLSRAATAQTDVHATAAVRLIFKHLLTTYESPNDLVARDAMAMAAFYAGLAFGRTSVGYVHGIAHQLGRFCGTPHGNANAMVLPEVLAAYGDCVHTRLAQLARLTGVSADASTEQDQAKRFIEAITSMRVQMGMPTRPDGLQREQLPTIIDAALAEAGSLYPVPRYMNAQELRALVEPLLAS